MTTIDWRLLDGAVQTAQKHPQQDSLAPFREAAYTGNIPWGHYEAVKSPWNIGELIESMARTFTTGEQLARIFVLMDEARHLGHMPGATAHAGDVLMNRAHGKPGYPPLPADWSDRAYHAYAGGPDSSGAYWAAAMLRSGGHHAPTHESQIEDQGDAGMGLG